MNKKDWRDLTNELIADFESRSFEQIQEIEAKVKNLMPRESHPRPITLLIAEIKRLRKDEDLLFDTYTQMRKERDSLLDKESIAEKAIQEFLTLNPHLEVAKDMMCILKDEHRELYDILFERVME